MCTVCIETQIRTNRRKNALFGPGGRRGANFSSQELSFRQLLVSFSVPQQFRTCVSTVSFEEFSTISTPLTLLHQMSVELTFENFSRCWCWAGDELSCLLLKFLRSQLITKVTTWNDCRADFWISCN